MSRSLVPLAVVPLLALAACGAPTDGGGAAPGSTGAASVSCAKESLTLTTPGKFTVGTDTPAYGPWFKDNKPANGQGYESAVAYAIAHKLGFATSDVTWATVSFNAAVAPGPKKFDIDLNQISISKEREQAVDFSSGYYDVRQAVVSYKGSPIDGKKRVGDITGAKLGAMVGSTSYKVLEEQVKPSIKPSVFDTNDMAVQALKNHQIDGLVVDLPTAFYMIGAQLEGGVITGQLPAAGTTEQFGAVLDKGSALTPCVSKAVDALRADGTLAKLEKQWLSSQGAPELK